MDLEDKSQKIAENITQINRLIHMRHHELAKRYNLTHDQFHLLVHLDCRDEPPTIGQIAAKAGKAQNTISEKVTRLEEKGLVERLRDENDRRISRVVMTKEGIDLINRISQQARYEFVFNALEKIDINTVDNILKGLEEIINKLDEE